MIISPSILACDFANIESELNALKGIEKIWIHLDIMDGHFVENLTFGIPVVKRIAEVTRHKLDAHLMVTNPEFHITKMRDFGLHNITFHYEAVKNPLSLIEKAKGDYPNVGLSIRPQTGVAELSDEVLRSLDLVLIMSVNPGLGGQSFLPVALDKIATLKKRRKSLRANFIIQVDGGINRETARRTIAVGADNLVAGSYIFNGPQNSYRDNIESLGEWPSN